MGQSAAVRERTLTAWEMPLKGVQGRELKSSQGGSLLLEILAEMRGRA